MIYLDNAATTKPNNRALSAAIAYAAEYFYNPSTRYAGGFEVSAAIERAREYLLSSVAGEKYALTFTSGGTESDNLAILSAARRGNAVTTMGEHAAVERCFSELKQRGVEPRFAPLLPDGRVDGAALLALMDEKTSLVSVCHVGSETGAVNDIAAISKAVKQKNPRCVFMSDGVQAFGKLPFRLPDTVDLYTVSAHKIGGLKGTGALFRKKSLALGAQIFGGGQEGGLRSGTENVLGILAFYEAAKDVFPTLETDAARVKSLREQLISALDGEFYTRLSAESGTPYVLTVAARGMRGEVLMRMLWDRGVVVGTGSACSSKHPRSRALAACGIGEDLLDGVLRLSFSRETTDEEVLIAAREMNGCAREFSQATAR